MVARLGYVLYWIGCGFAALFILGTLLAVGMLIAGYSTDPLSTVAGGGFCAIAALLCWGIGKALRYVLAGN